MIETREPESLIHVLYIDHDPLDRELVRDTLSNASSRFRLTEASNRRDFAERLHDDSFDIVVSDLNIDRHDGFDGFGVLEEVRNRDPLLPVVFVAATGTEKIGVEAMRRGAADYVIKSRQEIHRLPDTIRAVVENRALREELRDSLARVKEGEARNAAVLNTAVDAIITIDSSGVVETANPACRRVFGYEPEEIVGKNVKFLMPEPYTSEHDGYLERYLRTGEKRIIGIGREVEGRRKDGSTFPMELAVSEVSLGERLCFTGIVRDVTARKETERQIQRSEERYRDLFDSTHDMVQSVDPTGRFVFVNRTWRDALGYSKEEVSRITIFDVVHPESVSHCKEVFSRVMGGETISDVQAAFRAKDGTKILVEGSAKPRIEDGQVVASYGFFRDVTDRTRAEERVIDLGRVLERSLNEIYIFDVRTLKFIQVNRGARENIGYSMEELRDLTPLDIKPEYTLEKFLELTEPLRCKKQDKCVFTTVHRRKNGTEYPVEIHLQQSLFGGQEVFVAIILDITERKKVEQELIEKASLAKLGEMSAVVAHEVKNPLAGIIGAARMLSRRLPAGSEEREIAQVLGDRAQSLNRGVKDILDYSRPRAPEKQKVPVRLLFDDLLTLMSNDPDFEKVEVSVSCSDDALASCDVEMLRPVFLNILINAAQAMKAEGRIEVIAGVVEDGGFQVAFHDSGPGIAEAALEKIFEPFFTTKGRGTGLGLPIAKRVVELHGGEISIVCPPGGGTQVVIKLPKE